MRSHHLGLLFVGLMLASVFVLLAFASSENNHKKERCQAAGGTWFYHEQKCLAIKSIPVE